MPPSASEPDNKKEKATVVKEGGGGGDEEAAASAVKPDPDYEFRRQAMDLIEEWQSHDSDSPEDKALREQTLLPRVRTLVKHNLTHNAEIDACDLLMELDQVKMLKEIVDEHTDYERICLYLMSCVPYAPDPDNVTLINVAKDLYLTFGKRIEALRCAMKVNDLDAVQDIFNNCHDGTLKMQMAMMLGRQQIFLDIDNQSLSQLNANVQLHKHFLAFGRELDLMTPKTPEEVYKSHLEPTRPFNAQQMKNAPLQNLASSFVNGFVNSGFGTDAFFKDEKSSVDWLGKHKEWAAFSTAATFGLIHHWNVDSLNEFENHTQSRDVYIKAGSLFACGVVFSGVQDPDIDPAYALLEEIVSSDQLPLRVASIFGLGLAYANSKRETADKVVEKLLEVLNDDAASATAEVKGLAALSLGLILVGTGREKNDVVVQLITFLMSGVDLNNANMRFVALGIGLIFLGKQDQCDETILEPLRALPNPFGKIASILVDVCAYAGTGNVLKVQEMLHICAEQPEHKDTQQREEVPKPPPGVPFDITAKPPSTAVPAAAAAPTANGGEAAAADGGPAAAAALAGAEPAADAPATSAAAAAATPKAKTPQEKKAAEEAQQVCLSQAIAVLGISLVAMGEDIGSQMSLRLFANVYRYGEPLVRRAVPLALAMLSPSNPQLTIIETLSKYSHDSDTETARNAIFALGLVGAGTNNARVLATLRQLASYHNRDQKTMMLLRIAQGLVHMGKGTMTLNPFHSDRQLMCPTAVAALLTTCMAFIDADQTILNGRQHYLLFTLVAAIQPRMLITVVQDPEDREQLIQKPVQVRVGQAVDVVAQAGKPRTITGFQTHTTPVLLGFGERAELADNEEYVPQTPVLEGIVILKKKEDGDGEKMEH